MIAILTPWEWFRNFINFERMPLWGRVALSPFALAISLLWSALIVIIAGTLAIVGLGLTIFIFAFLFEVFSNIWGLP